MKYALSTLAVLVVLTGCRRKVFPLNTINVPQPAAVNENAPQTNAKLKESNAPVHIVVVDRTSASERPVTLEPKLQALAVAAAKKAGLVVEDSGQFAGAEFHYAIVQGDKMVPNAERGLLTWTIMVTLRIEDDMGLAEDIKGVGYGEAPYVRAAVPNLEKALLHVLRKSTRRAFLDVRMQREYRNYDAATAIKGLGSREPEELWAAMRRLGELKDKTSVPKIQEILETQTGVTAEIAMGVLGRIKDERAVKPLAAVAASVDINRARSAIHALLAIGSDDALEHIKRIGQNHPSPEIRAMIKQLLSD